MQFGIRLPLPTGEPEAEETKTPFGEQPNVRYLILTRTLSLAEALFARAGVPVETR